MSCKPCATAEQAPLHPVYIANCEGCNVRMLANGPAHFEAKEANTMTPAYRAELERNFGDAWLEKHRDVKAMHYRHQQARRSMPNWREVKEKSE